MSGSISPSLKDTSFGVDPATGLLNPGLLATLNADPRIRSFYVEPGTVVNAGDWVTVSLTGTSPFGAGNSCEQLDTGAPATNVPVGVALESAAPVAGGADVWITVCTRGVAIAMMSGVTAAGDRLIAGATAGEADVTGVAPFPADRIGYALAATGGAGLQLAYVTCE